jgi:hypothetical protein
MGRIRLLTLFLFLLICPASYGQSLLVHGFSVHTVGEHNNRNFGVGYVTADNIAFGVYKNSEYATSGYIGYRFNFANDFGLVVGGATGYRNRSISPLFMPFVRFPLDWFSIIVGISPYKDTDLGKIGLLVHTAVEYKW